jgi:hypothetical protein
MPSSRQYFLIDFFATFHPFDLYSPKYFRYFIMISQMRPASFCRRIGHMLQFSLCAGKRANQKLQGSRYSIYAKNP